MALSLMGVSITRSQPNRSSKPSLVLNAPPYTPTSSPINRTVGSRSISSNMACRIASRKVISFPLIADPLVGAPFGPGITTSASFARPRRQPLRISWSRSFPLASQPFLTAGRYLPDPRQPRSYRQNESAHPLRRNLCLNQIQERSTQLRRWIAAASLQRWAVPTWRESCGNRRPCNRHHPQRTRAGAWASSPQTRVPQQAVCPACRQSLSFHQHREVSRCLRILRTEQLDPALPSKLASPSGHIPLDRAARGPAAETFSLRSKSALRPRVPARRLPCLCCTRPPRCSHPRCNCRSRTPWRDPPNFRAGLAASPASNTPKDCFPESTRKALFGWRRNSALRETRPWSYRHRQSRSGSQSFGLDSVLRWPRPS